MQVNQVTQNHKSNQSFQRLTVNISSPPKSFLFRAVREALTPRKKEVVSRIVAYSNAAYDYKIDEIPHSNRLHLSITSLKEGQTASSFIIPSKKSSVKRFAQEINAYLEKLRRLSDAMKISPND